MQIGIMPKINAKIQKFDKIVSLDFSGILRDDRHLKESKNESFSQFLGQLYHALKQPFYGHFRFCFS